MYRVPNAAARRRRRIMRVVWRGWGQPEHRLWRVLDPSRRFSAVLCVDDCDDGVPRDPAHGGQGLLMRDKSLIVYAENGRGPRRAAEDIHSDREPDGWNVQPITQVLHSVGGFDPCNGPGRGKVAGGRAMWSGSYGGFLVKWIVRDGVPFLTLSVCHVRRLRSPSWATPLVRPVGLQARIRWNHWFRTMLPHSRGRRGLEGGTNLDGGISQP